MSKTLALDLLLQRLAWPSGMVRERTCIGISNALVRRDTYPLAKKGVLKWLKQQRLESIICNGLLAWIHKQSINGVKLTKAEIEDVRDAIGFPSALSWVLLKHLIPDEPIPNWQSLNSGTAPQAHATTPDFRKHIHILPQNYISLAETISKSGVDFFKQWEYEWNCVLTRCGRKPYLRGTDLWGRSDDQHITVYDTQLSETYRSAFLRALAWATMIGALSASDSEILATKICPVDVGIWRVQPSKPLQHWPSIQEEPGTIDTIPIEIWRQVEQLWEEQRRGQTEWVLSQASGRVHSGNSNYDLEIYGVLQSCHGPKNPELEKILDWSSEEIPYILMQDGGIELKGPIIGPSIRRVRQRFSDWQLIPLATQVRTWTIPRWQYWRMFRGVWGPIDLLNEGLLKVRCTKDAVWFLREKNPIARWSDWSCGLTETSLANLSPATGEMLLINRKIIEKSEAKQSMVFCWLCRITGYNREHKFGQFKLFHDYRIFGERLLVQA